MCLVQVLLNPFAVDLVGTAVTGKRVHVPCGLLEFPENFSRIINEEILVHHMVAGKQDAYRCGKGRRQSLRSVESLSYRQSVDTFDGRSSGSESV